MGLDGILAETVGVECRAGAVDHALDRAVLLQLFDRSLLLLVAQGLVLDQDLLQHQRGFLLGALLPVFCLALDGLVSLHDGKQFLDGCRLFRVLCMGMLRHHEGRNESGQNSDTSKGFEHCDSLVNTSVLVRTAASRVPAGVLLLQQFTF
ncbi:hypothetical protein D3C81_1522160 [compost metagenome]